MLSVFQLANNVALATVKPPNNGHTRTVLLAVLESGETGFSDWGRGFVHMATFVILHS